LSELRAAAVVEQLDRRGIQPRPPDLAGFGEDKPVAPNTTDEGRARNRRVELHIRASAAAGAGGSS